MTIQEMITEVINDYVSSNGTSSIMDKDQLYAMVSEVYQINKNSFLPADFCYNRTNEGIDFEKHTHLFERLDDGRYLVLGEDYPYSGPVYYRRRGETEDSVRGIWTNGLYEAGAVVADVIELRFNDLFEGVKNILKTIPVTISADKNVVSVRFQELLVCGVSVEEEVYKIFNVTTEWSQKTSYHCDPASDGTWFYYLETIDECIGEVQRLVLFEAQKDNKKPSAKGEHTSDLSKTVTVNAFEQAYIKFIEQADKNAISKKAQGSKTPYGFSVRPECDGAHFKQQFGQGTPSSTPYMNWWVVSIYYLPENGNIIMGIEEDRYPHLKEMNNKPLRYEQIGNKKTNIAVFYAAAKDNVNYGVLYESFITVCEEVMQLGLT